MTIQPGANVYTQGFGSRPENVEVPVIANSNPSPSQTQYPVGKEWINSSTNDVFILTSLSTTMGEVSATWTQLTTAAEAGIKIIDGDTGSATGTTVTFDANANAGASVFFKASGATVDLTVTDAVNNTFIGQSAGVAEIEGVDNTSVGASSLASIAAGDSNTCLGFQAGLAIQNGSNNTAIGAECLASITGSTGDNTAVGATALTLCTGSLNTAIGQDAGATLLSGSSNILIGRSAGSAYTGAESNNIIIGTSSVLGDNNIIRIGSTGTGAGQQSQFVVAGVAGVSVANQQFVTINTTTGQLGSVAGAVSGFVLIQSQSAANSPSLNFTTGINGTYSTYALVYSDLVPATSGTFFIQLSTDGGATYLNSGYQSGLNSNPYNSATITNINSTNFFYIASSTTTASSGASGIIYLYGLPTTNTKMCTGFGNAVLTGAATAYQFGGTQSTASVVNALTVVANAGNISSGTVKLYGIS